MSDDTPKPKPKFRDINGKPKDTFMPPESMGKMKGPSVIDMSLDELIEYRMTGQKPQRILDADTIFGLARIGVSIDNICDLFKMSKQTFMDNAAFKTAHAEGRAGCGTRIRAMIYQHAENGSLAAAQYLDKITGGDVVQENVNLTVTQRPLEQVDTEQLIEIAFKEKKE